MINVDPRELEKFSELAHRWWDPNAEFRPLHEINPLRLDHIDRAAALSGKSVLDVGCGGGILAESMAARGARVTGIDLSQTAIGLAQKNFALHGETAEELRVENGEALPYQDNAFDVVYGHGVIQYTADPARLVKECARVLRPGGRLVLTAWAHPSQHRLVGVFLDAVAEARAMPPADLPRGPDFFRFSDYEEFAARCGNRI